MSLGETILKLRKKNGLSQEELGDKIKVTRQTISNWELGETNPNPKQLKLLSKELNISIDELLDNNIVDKRVSNNALFLVKTIIIIIILVILTFLIIKMIKNNNQDKGRIIDESIHCKIYGEEHSYAIKYYELNGEPIEVGGDTYFSDILELSKYFDAHQIFNVINDYVKKNGGTCEMINEKDLNNIVNISIKEGSLTNTGVTIIITENVDYDISYGETYKLEKFNYSNNNWEELPIICSNCGFNLPAYGVTPNNPLILHHDWERLYGRLNKGLYRLMKRVFFDSDIPINEEDEYYIWVEFSIDN